ncbi:DHRS11.2 family protein [Megaselia abdita]
MERWAGKTAVVTGASSGIGAAIVLDLVKNGMQVVALARREERLKEMKNNLPKNLQSKLHPKKCDVTKEDDVINAFKWVDQHLGGVHVLVNCAGVLKNNQLVNKNNTEDIRATIDTNIMGVVFCTREAFQSMKARKVAGHVVNINSVAGQFPLNLPNFNIYPASKYAITAMTESYRREFDLEDTNIKITSISPGLVDTEILPGHAHGENVDAKLKAEDVSNAVLYCIGTPIHVQIHEIIIRPLREKF